MAADFASLVTMFESAASRAADGSTMADATAWLSSFTAHRSAIAVAKSVLERSKDDVCPFYAVNTIRDVLMRNWSTLTADDRNLRHQLLAYAEAQYDALRPPVRNQLLQTVALAWKRGWSEATAADKAALLHQLPALLGVQSDGRAAEPAAPIRRQLVGVKLCLHLVQEFGNTDKATAMGVPFEFHRSAHASFQADGLLPVFQVVCMRLLTLVPAVTAGARSAAPLDPQLVEVVTGCLVAMEEALNWDFQRRRPRWLTVVKPGKAWAPVLTSPHLSDALFALHACVRGHYDSPLPLRTRAVIIQLCSLAKDVFPDAASRTAVCQRLVRGLVATAAALPAMCTTGDALAPLRAHGGALAAALGAEALDCGTAFRRLATNYSVALLASLPEFPTVVGTASNLTHRLWACAAAASVASTSAHVPGATPLPPAVVDYYETEQPWCTDAVDVLLEFWGEVVDAPAGVTAPHAEALRTALARMYEALVTHRLAMAAAAIRGGVDDDDPYEDVTALDDHMQGVAVVGRFCPQQACGLLVTRLTSALSALSALSAGGGGDARGALVSEELWWLASFAGYLLADACEGETGMVPQSLNALSVAAARASRGGFKGGDGTGANDPVVQLTSGVFETCRVAQTSPAASPMLHARLLWFTRRWVGVYLMPDLTLYTSDALSITLSRMYGSTAETLSTAPPTAASFQSAPSVLAFIVRHVHVVMQALVAEQAVAEQGVAVLRAIVANKPACAEAVKSTVWRELVAAHLAAVAAAGDTAGAAVAGAGAAAASPVVPPVLAIPSVKVQATLTQVLVTSTRSVDSSAKRDYLSALLTPVATRLRHVLSSPVFASLEGHPAVAEAISRLLANFGGVSNASPLTPREWVWEALVPILDVGVQLIDKFRGDGAVTSAVLHYFVCFMSSQLPFVTASVGQPVYTATGRLFQTYAKHRQGKAVVGDDAEAEVYKHVKQLLRVLKHAVEKDLLDFSPPDAGAPPAPVAATAADVVVYGVQLVIPLMTAELLKYAKLCSLYMEVVVNLVDGHPDKLATLEAGQFETLLQSLEFGIRHHSTTTARESMEALFTLAKYQCKAAGAAAAGAPATLAPATGLNRFRRPDGTLLVRFVQLLLLEAFKPEWPSALDNPAANALLAIIQAEGGPFRAFVVALVDMQSSDTHKARLTHAFEQLVSGMPGNLLPPALRKFQTHWKAFVQDVQGFVRIK